MPGNAQGTSPMPRWTDLGSDLKPSHNGGYFQRRLRHLTSIQIRNLTPFPIRDAFASALSQPATHSQFTPLGNLSDDLDVTLLRRRSRRISTTSVNTLKNVAVDDVTGALDDMRGSGEGRGRRRAQSRVGFPAGVNTGPAPGPGTAMSRSLVASTSTPAARHTRIRTTSAISSHGLSASISSAAPTNSVSNNPVTSLCFEHSQRTLEKVVRSRLVETFVTIAVPEPPLSPSPPSVNGKSRSRADSGPSTSPTTSNTSIQATYKATRTSASIGAARMLSPSTVSHGMSRLSTSKVKSPPAPRQISSPSAAARTHKVSSSAPLQKTSSHHSPLPSSIEASVFPKVPNYISPIHRPSTNPLYCLDALSQSEFSEHTNLGADMLRIQLWAKVDLSAMHLGNAKGKQKDNEDTEDAPGSPRWKVLEEWDFYLSDLIPLSPELGCNPSQLPSNTLVMSFLPTDQCFHLPPPAWSRSRSQSRSPSPSGYNTDPELEGRKLIQSAEVIPPIPDEIIRDGQLSLGFSRRSRRLGAKTASLEELLQLVALHAGIKDTEESLRDVVREINVCLAKDHALILKREASERQARIDDWRTEIQAVIEGSNRLRVDLATRRIQIRARRDRLTEAKALQVQERTILSDQVAQATGERHNLIIVRNRLPSIRMSLISTLATIYPIDLLSPSELLFTILAVPLPIPFHSNEPAPPVSLSSHKEVTEESVATALGYAAHLVQLLSVYMGKGLVYPITYIGSRSLIRDNISAMVGPRMFPLFSKGVDTYRFEYAVFLLNKDIEMLMADRDLRALDMRHTLPNLKNLLLTLTDGESPGVHNPRRQDSPSTRDLSALSHAAPPLSVNQASETPKVGRSPSLFATELPQESSAFPSSGLTTPKAGQSEGGLNTLSRYSKLSLGFPPLPGFFRSRNSPTTPGLSAKSTTDTTEGVQEGGAIIGILSGSLEAPECDRAVRLDDDDDRRTVKGVAVDTAELNATPELKQGGSGPIPDGGASGEEKIIDATSMSGVSTVVPVDSFV